MNELVKVSNYDSQKEFLQTLIDSGQLPSNIKKPETAFTIAAYGKELGFNVLTSFNYIVSIQGKLTLSAKAQQALLRKNGITWRTIEDFYYCYEDGSIEERKIAKKDANGVEIKINDIRTVLEFTRNGVIEIVKFYWSDATKAGLTDKDVWKKYPKALMFARCFTIGATRIASDMLLGFYSSDEIVDSSPQIKGEQVHYDENGKVIGYDDYSEIN